MKLGAHIGTAGGLLKTAEKANLLGCEAIQIFTSNPRSWTSKPKEKSELNGFKEKLKEYKIKYAFGHAIYLVNLASPNKDIYNKSIESIACGLKTSEDAGLLGVVTHLGSHSGITFEEGIKNILNALEKILSSTKNNTSIILETDAGSGNRIGCKFSDIGLILKSIKSDSIKVCLDTCHSFASGYDFRNKKGIEKTFEEFEKEIGLKKLALIHLNDSKGGLGSNLDRHEVIGEGTLGIDTFELIVNHPYLKNIPGILETPDVDTGAKEIESLKILKAIQKINT